MLGKRRLIARSALILALLSALLLIAARPAQAQTETVLYSFCSMPSCADGATPDSGLILDATGFLYGETRNGGDHRYGTVFMASVHGGESVLHSFANGITAYPRGGLLRDAKGTLYGTNDSSYYINPKYFGGVFELKRGVVFHYLHKFLVADQASGWGPVAPLVMDAKGNLYGTAYSGGTGGCLCGVVFEITASGTATVVYTFAGGTDGANPSGGLISDGKGDLYGTTFYGGTGSGCRGPQSGCGTLFKVTPGGTETVLYSFTGETDGGYPNGDLALDAQGNLYGTTGSCGSYGCNDGAVFKLTPDGTKTILHSFAGGTDGAYPTGSLVLDAQGNLYGTAAQGGGSGCYGGYGCGIVFKLTPQGAETILYRFNGSPADGAYPAGGLVFDAQGNLYGTTAGGGAYGDEGTIFKITP